MSESKRTLISLISFGLKISDGLYLPNLDSFCSSIYNAFLILTSDSLISSLILDGLLILRGDPILSVPNWLSSAFYSSKIARVLLTCIMIILKKSICLNPIYIAKGSTCNLMSLFPRSSGLKLVCP